MQLIACEAKRTINALKTGVIPDTDLNMLCTGRDRVMKEFERCLDFTGEGGSCVKFVSGEYGSGKSFILSKIRQLAVERNFIVSRIQLNRSSHLYNPEILYYSIMHNLASKTLNSGGTDFEELFDNWIGSLKTMPSREHASREIRDTVSSLDGYNSSFARAFLTYIRARISNDGELSAAASSWIKGEKNIPAALKARFDVKGDINRSTSMDSLKAFVHLLKKIGYDGLVVLIDELEIVMNLRSDIRKGCYENTRYIVDSCGCGDFKNCMFVFAGTDAVFENPEKGIKTYHALYQRLGDAIGRRTSHSPDMRQPVISLRKFDNDELLALTKRIINIHSIAYNWKPAITYESARNWALLTLSREKRSNHPVNTREFVMKLTEILDILEQNPGYNIFNTELKIVNRSGTNTFVNTLPGNGR